MKKKLLLIALPALMALSGCSGVSNKPVKSENDLGRIVLEDNLAHEELFGSPKQKGGVAIKKAPIVDTNDDYKIGYQLHYDNGADGITDTEDDTISIRFIAAIKAEYSSMIWSRGVARGDGVLGIGFGSKLYNSDDDLASTVVYHSLSNGLDNDVITAGSGTFSGYTGFIVYSMIGIPYSSYNKDSYIGASVTLHPAEGADIVTPVYALKIERNPDNLDQSLYSFSFENGNQGYFLNGTFNSVKKNVPAERPTRNDNRATFSTDFKTNDEFLIVKKTTNEFLVWSSASIPNEGNPVHGHFGGTTTGSRIKALENGHFRLYLNNDDPKAHLYAGDDFTPTGLQVYLRGSMNSWLNDATDEQKAPYELYSDGGDSRGVVTNVQMSVNDEFQIAPIPWGNPRYGYGDTGGHRIRGTAAGNFTGDDQYSNLCNVRCTVAGTYNIMVGNDYNIWISLAA